MIIVGSNQAFQIYLIITIVYISSLKFYLKRIGEPG